MYVYICVFVYMHLYFSAKVFGKSAIKEFDEEKWDTNVYICVYICV